MYISKTILILLFLLFLISCKKEEALLGVDNPSKYFYLVTSNQPNSLKLLEIPSLKIIEEDLFFNVNKSKLSDISQIAEFRGYLYFFQRDHYKITVTTSDSLKFVQELDWQNSKLKPASIAFVNATTAFISFYDTALVAVLDLTNFNVSKEIYTSVSISYLDNVGNLVVGLSSKTGKLVVIDSRTYSEVKTIFVGDNPISFAANPEKNLLYVLCQGKGKTDTLITKTNAKLVTVSLPEFNIVLQTDITIGAVSSQNLVPTGISISNRYFGYISSLSGFLRFNLSNPTQVQRYIAGEFYNLLYNYKRDEVVALSKSGSSSVIYIINPNNSAVLGKYTFNNEILLIFPKE